MNRTKSIQTRHENGMYFFLDEKFPERVFQMSFLLSLILILCSLSYMSFMLTFSISMGCFLSIALFRITWFTIQNAVTNKRTEMKGYFLKISLLKYFFVCIVLFSVCVFLEINVAAMSLGMGIVMAVIVMKVAGKLLVNFMNKSVKFPFKDIG